MGLKSDGYDPSPCVDKLHEQLRSYIGEPIYRMIAPEIVAFFQDFMGAALLSAFSRAEALYINDMVKQSEQASRNMLEAALAMTEVERIKAERTTKQDTDL